jgi:hypothetical protein
MDVSIDLLIKDVIGPVTTGFASLIKTFIQEQKLSARQNKLSLSKCSSSNFKIFERTIFEQLSSFFENHFHHMVMTTHTLHYDSW